MGKLSREKGKRGERECAAFCGRRAMTAAGQRSTAERPGQAADVVGLPGVHIEVKRTERLDLYGALDQARRDAKSGELPVVFHRRNNCRWVVIQDAEDWFKIYREYDAGRPRTEIRIEGADHVSE